MALRAGHGRGEPYHSIDLEAPSVADMPLSDDSHQAFMRQPQTAPGLPVYQSDFSHSGNAFNTPVGADKGSKAPSRPTNSRSSSWDFLGIHKEWENDGTHGKFQYAPGDAPTKLAKLYFVLLNSSIITRWIIFIVPILALLWIPGILSLTAYKKASVWHVRLIWWSVWLSIIWVGWWGALAFAMLLPHLLTQTLGLGARELRKYFDMMKALTRPVAFLGWAIAVYVSYAPVIHNRFTGDDAKSFPSSANALSLIAKLATATLISAAILLGEKFLIQFVAYKFHQTSYADRIMKQKAQIDCLVVLYSHSRNIDRADTMHDNGRGGHGHGKSASVNPRKILKKAFQGVRATAEASTAAFGNIATEISGTAVISPHSPAGMVNTALSSVNKSRMLARRLYYSFRTSSADKLVVGDIARFFDNPERGVFAFEIFDKDENGDASREEMEAAIVDIHTERLSLAASMKDVDSATGALDSILMSLYGVVLILVFAVALDASFQTLITGAGTLILGLSWLIGASAQEVLASIVFLFIKHPFDIGDAVEIDAVSYTIKEIRLLSTVLVDLRGCNVQAPNVVLNTKYIMNKRRSGPMSETFEFMVAYGTTFEQIEDLRARMLSFLRTERRDFMPVFDVQVVDIPDQGSMKLKADIKYKSNWQQGALKAQRRNKWVCALKNTLTTSKVFGSSGDPDAVADPQKVTLVPFAEPNSSSTGQMSPGEASSSPASEETKTSTRSPTAGVRTNYAFADPNVAIMQGMENVFGPGEEREERQVLPEGSSMRSRSRSVSRRRPPVVAMDVGSTSSRAARPTREEEDIEMQESMPRRV